MLCWSFDAIAEPQTPAEIAETGELLTALLRATFDEVAKLTPPADEQAAVDEFLDAFESIVETGEVLYCTLAEAGDAAAQDPDAQAAFAEFNQVNEAASQLSGVYGLEQRP